MTAGQYREPAGRARTASALLRQGAAPRKRTLPAMSPTARGRLALAVIVLGSLFVPQPVDARRRAFELDPGTAVFWRGPHIEDSSTARPGPGCPGAPCWTYRLHVTERTYRLRIGIDHPEVSDVYDVTVTAPNGTTTHFSPGTGLYSAESLHPRPQPGIWRVRVHAEDVTDSAFRMRAKLEARPPRKGRGRIPPNLQVLPPHDASFLFPVTNGMSDPSRGLDLAGAESCHPEEHVEFQAVRCLRFAFGIRNTGKGPLELHTEGTFPLDQALRQRVYRANGSFVDRRAGVARYHKTHAHYHHHDAVALKLFRVSGKQHSLSPASSKHFKGFAHRDELLREWRRFYPVWSKNGFGLLAGWSDIYEWDRPGNYIDFGLNGDGRYVLRMWADPVDGILESNERDNLGYTYFRVAGDEVKLLEAGRGRDPWDPCKIEVGFGGHPDPPDKHRPRRCPPDTT